MGLANIKKCADYMKLESQMGGGTTLEIIIYLKPESNGESSPLEERKQEPS